VLIERDRIVSAVGRIARARCRRSTKQVRSGTAVLTGAMRDYANAHATGPGADLIEHAAVIAAIRAATTQEGQDRLWSEYAAHRSDRYQAERDELEDGLVVAAGTSPRLPSIGVRSSGESDQRYVYGISSVGALLEGTPHVDSLAARLPSQKRWRCGG
jgi:hypothetical protein